MHVYAGTDALLILGTTSEASTLTDNEKDEVVSFIIKRNNNRLKIVVGVITNNTLDGYKKAQKYESMGADYLLVSPPYYNKTNSSGLLKHFEYISKGVCIPILIYNVPSRIGMNIKMEEFTKLKAIKNIVGVKESNKDINQIIELANICDDNFNLYCGNDDLSYLFLSLGAKGLINVYGNIDPKGIKNLLYLYLENELLARKYFFEHYNIFKLLFIETNPIPIKALMNCIGMDVGGFRLPLDTMSENNLILLKNEYLNTVYK